MAAKELAKEVGQIAVQAHDEVELLIEKLHNQLLASQNRIYSIDSSIRFAEEYYQVKQDAFAEGLIPATELIDAELNLAKAKTERLEAAYKYDITLAKLLEAAGVSTEFINYTHRDNVKIIE